MTLWLTADSLERAGEAVWPPGPRCPANLLMRERILLFPSLGLHLRIVGVIRSPSQAWGGD